VALRLASQALLAADPELAEEVIADDADLDADRGRCEQHAERLVAVHASVPADLRSIVAVVLSADGIQRMGHLPVHIAAAVRSSDPGLVVPAELRDVVAEVVAITTGMADRVAVLVADPARAGLAELRSARGTVHNLSAQVLRTLTRDDWRYGVPAAISLAVVTWCYGRFADRAVSVACRLDVAASGGPHPDAVPAVGTRCAVTGALTTDDVRVLRTCCDPTSPRQRRVRCALESDHRGTHACAVSVGVGGREEWWLFWLPTRRALEPATGCPARIAAAAHEGCNLPLGHPGRHSFELVDLCHGTVPPPSRRIITGIIARDEAL